MPCLFSCHLVVAFILFSIPYATHAMTLSQTTLLYILAYHHHHHITTATEPPDWKTWMQHVGLPPLPCKHDRDCANLGTCMPDHTCHCDAGFKGRTCEELDLMPADPSWGFADSNYPSWGGTVLEYKGEYHLVASFMENKCDITTYGTNSAVMRASASTPQGPFTYRETILPAFHHGAHVIHDTLTNRFLIFADGKAIPKSALWNCNDNVSPSTSSSVTNTSLTDGDGGGNVFVHGHSPHDQVVVATSNNLIRGQWTEHVILKTSSSAYRDAWFCNKTNPAPLLDPHDGSLTLFYRTTYCNRPARCKGVPGEYNNHCQHITSTRFTRSSRLQSSSSPQFVPENPDIHNMETRKILQLDGSEDPFIWRGSRDTLHLLVHSKNACGEWDDVGCGVLAHSFDDGKTWLVAHHPAYTKHVVWLDGKREALRLRQRPKIFLDPVDGITPLFLYNGGKRETGGKSRTFAFPFAVPRNSHLAAAMSPPAPDSTTTAISRALQPPTLRFPTTTTTTTTTPKRPINFVLIHLDDVGYGDVSAYKQPNKYGEFEGMAKTPHIDAMSEEGVLFTSFYSAACVCTPSRAGMLTGRYPIRTSLHPGVLGPHSAIGLPPREITIAKWLSQHGPYRTHMAGKWHLGHLVPFLPINHGFDSWLGMPYSHDFCPCPTTLTHTTDNHCRPSDPPCPLMNGSLIIQQPAILKDLIDLYVESTLNFITNVRAESQHRESHGQTALGFFVYYACHHTHHPQFIHPRNRGISKALGGRDDEFGDAVMEMDMGVGRILDFLRDSAIKGETHSKHDTFVLLASDNGAALAYHKLAGSNGVLRCGKGTTWEGGQRVPFIVWGAQTIAGKVEDSIVSGTDVFATVMSLSGGGHGIPTDRTMDSIDFSSLILSRRPAAVSRTSFIYYTLHPGTPGAVRIGHYKVHFRINSWMESPKYGITPSCHFGTEKLDSKLKRPLVFDVHNDPGETRDLAASADTTDIAVKAINEAHALLKAHKCFTRTDKNCDATPKSHCAGTFQIAPWPPRVFTPWRQTPSYCCAAMEEPAIYVQNGVVRYTCIAVPVRCAKSISHEQGAMCNPRAVLLSLRDDKFTSLEDKKVCMDSPETSICVVRETGKLYCVARGEPCKFAGHGNEDQKISCPASKVMCHDSTCVAMERMCENHGKVKYLARKCGSCTSSLHDGDGGDDGDDGKDQVDDDDDFDVEKLDDEMTEEEVKLEEDEIHQVASTMEYESKQGGSGSNDNNNVATQEGRKGHKPRHNTFIWFVIASLGLLSAMILFRRCKIRWMPAGPKTTAAVIRDDGEKMRLVLR